MTEASPGIKKEEEDEEEVKLRDKKFTWSTPETRIWSPAMTCEQERKRSGAAITAAAGEVGGRLTAAVVGGPITCECSTKELEDEEEEAGRLGRQCAVCQASQSRQRSFPVGTDKLWCVGNLI